MSRPLVKLSSTLNCYHRGVSPESIPPAIETTSGFICMLYEIEHTDSQGNHHFQDVMGHHQARIIARRLALATGHRVIIRKSPPREWRLLIANLQTGNMIESEDNLSKREAIKLWRDWQAKQKDAVLIFWPKWAKGTVKTDKTA